MNNFTEFDICKIEYGTILKTNDNKLVYVKCCVYSRDFNEYILSDGNIGLSINNKTKIRFKGKYTLY